MAAWTVQATAVGALQAQQHRISMLEQSAHPTSAQHWADYALYDCSACHHGLKAPSWRQRHRQPTPPGRPLPAQWPSILERTVARTCSDSSQSLADNYLRAVTAVPFGERMEVLQTAKAYRTALGAFRTAGCRALTGA